MLAFSCSSQAPADGQAASQPAVRTYLSLSTTCPSNLLLSFWHFHLSLHTPKSRSFRSWQHFLFTIPYADDKSPPHRGSSRCFKRPAQQTSARNPRATATNGLAYHRFALRFPAQLDSSDHGLAPRPWTLIANEARSLFARATPAPAPRLLRPSGPYPSASFPTKPRASPTSQTLASAPTRRPPSPNRS